MTRVLRASTFLLASVLSAIPVTAFGQEGDEETNQGGLDGYEEGLARERGSVRADAHLDLGWRGAYGFGLRLDIAVAPDGVLYDLDEDLALSLGGEAFLGPDAIGLWPLGAMQWNFYFARRWSVFPELGLVVMTGEKKHFQHADPFVIVAPFLSVGGRYHFSARYALLVRANWPAGLQVGLTF